MGNPNRQKCELAKAPSPSASEYKLKHVSFIVFEEAGKTILQPLVSGHDTQGIQELFQSKTLEVWLPNGQFDLAQFDVAILKYKQLMQPTKKCSRNKNLVCLKNHFETIASCEQCPLSADEAEDGMAKDTGPASQLKSPVEEAGLLLKPLGDLNDE